MKRWLAATVGGMGLWAIAVISVPPAFGVFDAATNPFTWLLNFIELLAAMLWIFGGGSVGEIITGYQTGSVEAHQIVGGAAALLAWGGTFIAMAMDINQNNRSKWPLYIVWLPLPLLVWLVAAYHVIDAAVSDSVGEPPHSSRPS